MLNATLNGILFGFCCLYACNTYGLPISFGFISIICLLCGLLLSLNLYGLSYKITSYAMIILGICGSIAIYVVSIVVFKISNTNKTGMLLSMILSIILIVLGMFMKSIEKRKENYKDIFDGANRVMFIITAPISLITIVFFVILVLLLSNSQKDPDYPYDDIY